MLMFLPRKVGRLACLPTYFGKTAVCTIALDSSYALLFSLDFSFCREGALELNSDSFLQKLKIK